MHHSTGRIAHTTAFVTPVVEHWLEREIVQWVHYEGSIQRPIAPRENSLARSHTLLHSSDLEFYTFQWSYRDANPVPTSPNTQVRVCKPSQEWKSSSCLGLSHLDGSPPIAPCASWLIVETNRDPTLNTLSTCMCCDMFFLLRICLYTI